MSPRPLAWASLGSPKNCKRGERIDSRPLKLLLLLSLACAEHEEGEEEIPADLAVHTEPLSRGTVQQITRAYGTVSPALTPDHPASAVLSSVQGGRIQQALCTLGATVHAGQVLYRLDSSAIDPQLAALDETVRWAQQVAERAATLETQGNASTERAQQGAHQHAAARFARASSKAQRAWYDISSPIAPTTCMGDESADLRRRGGHQHDLDPLAAYSWSGPVRRGHGASR